ncbi:hypothetical protein ABEB22_00290 [Thioclava sp. 'Guangxiensis']|uniref:hypothetical protein n=1 Tax=Thioclava sp. 'Guangxiensis' TaxID=3149044 RepID=UPI003877D217
MPDETPRPQVVLPAAARIPCASPASLLATGGTLADDAVSITRLGDELIACDGRRRIAVEAFERMVE